MFLSATSKRHQWPNLFENTQSNHRCDDSRYTKCEAGRDFELHSECGAAVPEDRFEGLSVARSTKDLELLRSSVFAAGGWEDALLHSGSMKIETFASGLN